MPIFLKILLFAMSVGTFAYVLRKIRKSQMKIEDAIFWILVSIAILVMSIFPKLVFEIAYRLNIESPSNFVYLLFIFILLIKVFTQSIKISQLGYKLNSLAQNIAIEEKINTDKENALKEREI